MLTDDNIGDQITVVVVLAGTTDFSEGNIYYINQDALGNKTTLLTNMGLKDGIEKGKEYEVRIGGSAGNIYTAKFTAGFGMVHYYGDINEDEVIDILDALDIIEYQAGNWQSTVFKPYVDLDTEESTWTFNE